jgi:D-glycero-D-manno-heptose 1,7-bisphosphate phosphatase
VHDRVVLLDRDGTIIVERNYLSDPENVELLPNAAAGLRLLRELGFRLVLVTNQSGIGRGYFTALTVEGIHGRLKQKLAAESVALDAIYICPHTPEEHCDCRKPEPGLALRAAMDFHFDLSGAVVIGDKPCDIELAQRIGATSVLVRTGYGAEYVEKLNPDIVADDLEDAAKQLRLLERK